MVKPHRSRTLSERMHMHGWKVDSNGCWIWQGSVSGTGYGQLSYLRSGKRAHRAAYELWVGPLTASDAVLHTCDVKLCINPQHLRKGTQGDNMADKMRKGRHRTNHGALSPEDVRSIREGYTTGLVTYETLGELYGVSREMVYKIVTRQAWREIL